MPAYGEAIVRAWAHAAGSALVRQACIGAADGKAQPLCERREHGKEENMEQEEIDELLRQCDKLRELVRAIAAAMDHAEKRLQRIERFGRIWLFREAYGNRREEDDN